MYTPYNNEKSDKLFEDTSNINSAPNQFHNRPNNPPLYGQSQYGTPNMGQQQPGNLYPQMPGLPGSSFIQDPFVTNMAMQYGQNLVGQSRQFMDTKIEKIVATIRMKYYFAVDTNYVLRKLKLLFFPFAHSEWGIKYGSESDEPVQPRFDINAPDLYIPSMAFVTYILVAGFCLGLRSEFSPDALGIQASWAVAWLLIELGVLMMSFYILGVNAKIQTLHMLALSSYKYVGMIACLLARIVSNGFGYYCVLAYTSLSIVVFIFRTFRQQIQGNPESMNGYSLGTKRRLYLLILISAFQPFMIWLLTFRLGTSETPTVSDL